MTKQLDLFEAADPHFNMTGDPWQRSNEWEGVQIWIQDLKIGDEVIAEHHRMDKYGKRRPSQYFRTTVGMNKTVSGPMWHLTSVPTEEFPTVPTWDWIYPSWGSTTYWKRSKAK